MERGHPTYSAILVLFQHHLGGLDDRFDGVAHLEFHLFRAALGDHAFDRGIAHFDRHVSHYSAQLNLDDFSNELVARRERHAPQSTTDSRPLSRPHKTVHGLAHLVGFVVPWRLAKMEQVPYKTTALGGSINIGDAGIRVIGILWLAVALAFTVYGIAIVAQQPWSVVVTTEVIAVSLALRVIQAASQIGQHCPSTAVLSHQQLQCRRNSATRQGGGDPRIRSQIINGLRVGPRNRGFAGRQDLFR
jgi:hypothetical protein